MNFISNNYKPLISIITPVYNGERYLEKTIQSVLSQNYKNIEYIIIDGGSTDGTIDIIKKYENNISYWVSEKDKGISDAFNKGLKQASGDIIAILNSDDWYEPDTLETVVKMFEKKDVFCIVGALRYWNEDNTNFIVNPEKDFSKRIHYTMPHLNHPASIFKKEVYDKIGGFNISYKYAMDYDFFLRVYKANFKLTMTDKILSNMRLGGCSDEYAIKTYYEVLQICDNKVLGFIYFIYSILKYEVRKILILFKLDKIISYIRKIKYKNL